MTVRVAVKVELAVKEALVVITAQMENGFLARMD